MSVTTMRLDIMTGPAECDTCPTVNPEMAREFPRRVTYRAPGAIYALAIGAGYRQPTFLCPDCLAKLRAVLGVEIRTAVCNIWEGA